MAATTRIIAPALQRRRWVALGLGFALLCNRCNSALQQGVDLSERAQPHHGCRGDEACRLMAVRFSAGGAGNWLRLEFPLEGFRVGFSLKVPLG